MSTQSRSKNSLMVIVGSAILAALSAATVLVPRTMQSPRLAANAEANRHIEKSRRLLAQYDTNLNVDAAYRQAHDEDSFKLSSDRLEALLDDPDFDILGDATTELEDYARLPAISGMGRAEDELLRLSYGENEWRQHKSPKPPSQVSGSMISKSASAYERKLADNGKVLREALQAVGLALGVSRGDYSTSQHAGANRLKGMILYQQGLAISRRVSLLRRQLAVLRFSIKHLQEQNLKLSQDNNLVTDSEIGARIAEAKQELDQVAARVRTQQGANSDLASLVADLDQRVTAAVERSEAAREGMAALEALGVDLSNPNGSAQFKQAYQEQAENYRLALAEAHLLQHGGLLNAVIDQGGDYLRGKYVPLDKDQDIQVQRGLQHYRQDLESAQAELLKMQDAETQLEESVFSLGELKRRMEERVGQATDSIQKRDGEIQQVYAELTDMDTRIREAQEEAIKLYEQASRSFKTAQAGVRDEENHANQDQPSDPQRLPFHYSSVAGNQGWLKGQLFAQQADTELHIAFLLLGRFQDAQAHLADLGQGQMVQADLPGWQEAMESAKEEAISRTESAIEILDDKAQNQIVDGNWTVAADIAAAHYVLSLLDVKLAAERSLEWYRVAVQGREELAQELVFMRDYVEARAHPAGE